MYNFKSIKPCYSIILVLLSTIIVYSCEHKEKVESVEDEISAIENSLTNPVIVKGENLVLFSIEDRMKLHKVPGVSIAVVKDGKLHWTKAYGIANTETGTLVDSATLFQAGSISKPVAALGALKLVQEGKIDLDTDVNNYLKNWKVEENRFTEKEKVTLRRLLTHTAGMTVHGFPGYKPTDKFPSIIKVLDGKGNTPKIFVDTIPGSIWRYSGGGYTVMEKVVEDVSGQPLETYLKENILMPLGMTNSTYSQPLPEKLHQQASAAYDRGGNLIEGLWHNYPEQAAAGLWTTPTDLAKYCMEIQRIEAGKTNGILSKKTVDKMLTKHENNWGLGPSLADDGNSLRFQHGGKNAGFTNNMIAFAYKGNAVIVMTNADNGGKLMNEIITSISEHYDWDIAQQRVVETVSLATEALNKFNGKYKYLGNTRDGSDYIVELVTKEGKLLVIDENNGEEDIITPMSETSFIDLSDGDEVVFTERADTIEFTFNKYYSYRRVE
ncbi:serine hydrolase domain-containing protein [Chondrinema litorale]|uniref:serine hydrolase domain-containing protein n=1 Tax=Chondrinema litorale TaxID=2994555 RepID=UPI00254277B5|nr:serine hydrolase [Chondrinema litorale]UZR99510.1 serine hydrolase [Chondrinema litorale]